LRDVNFTFGHNNGDLLLKEVGVRLTQLLHDGEIVARIGNVQFAVLLPDLATASAPSRALQFLDALEAPFPVANITYELGARIGIAMFPGHAIDAETLLRKADVALYQAKQSGQRYTIYHAAQDPYQPERLEMIGRFRRAIHEGQLQLYCQPKLNLQTKQVVGAEALVRWRHPELGLVAPNQFMPLIESTDLIHFLTQFMLEAAISQYYSWQQHGIHIPLAVNLSPRNLMEPDLVANLQYLLATWGAKPDWLGVEITEGTLLKDPVAAIAELHRLRRMGVRVFIDDFGTGYSSLSYLMRLPVDVIKIDHSFTMNMINDKGAVAIVKSTIELAHNLGMSVVAEGAESQEICDVLHALGCDEAQGYFISPPIPAESFMDWLSASGYQLS
jgi:diguanylate cyclase (GGDEF)-like protein